MSSLNRLVCGAVLVSGLLVALGRDARADAQGYICLVQIDKAGASNAAYTEIVVSVYSEGGCGGTWQGTVSFYSNADCTQASGCPAYNNQQLMFSDPAYSSIYSQLSDAKYNWRFIYIWDINGSGYGLGLEQ